MADALAKIYEITAYFDIALIAALVTVYAIIVSLMGRMLAWVREKLQEIRLREGDAEEKFRAKMASLKNKKPQEIIDELIRERETSKAELTKTESALKRRERLLSWGSIILITGGLLFISFEWTLVAILIRENSFWWSVGFYIGAAVTLLWALFRIALTLKEATELAKETSPQEKRELEKLFKDVLGLKKAEYEVHFLSDDDQPLESLSLKKDKEETVRLYIYSRSRFAVKDVMLSFALPKGFILRESLDDKQGIRHAFWSLYPEGAKLRKKISDIPSDAETEEEIEFIIKSEKSGNHLMFLWIHSTTHEEYKIKLPIIVEE